jgi:AAA lid domain
MDTFFQSNPGLSSRIAHHLAFPDYSAPELLQICERMLSAQNYALSPAANDAMARYIGLRLQQPHFANARSIRNALDRARLRQASRLFTDRDRVFTREDLTTLEPSDILASRVFTTAGGPA